MSRLLAVAARELRERWLLFPAALALDFVPFVLPVLGVKRDHAQAAGILFALLFGVASAVVIGSSMLGSQRQASMKTRPVQGELEQALLKLGWSGRSVIMSGRTDTGVHATGQVASVDLDWSHTDDKLLRALNSLLPADVAVRSVEVVDAKFPPRFDAIARRYRYRLFCQPLRDPMRERFDWHGPRSIRTCSQKPRSFF